MRKYCIHLLLHITVFITHTHTSWYITTPLSPQSTSVYYLKQEHHYSVYSLKNWQNWKKMDFIVLDWYSQCACAGQQMNTYGMYAHVIVWKYINFFLQHIWIVFKYVLRNCFLCHCGSVTFLCLALVWGIVLHEWVHRDDFIIRPSEDTLIPSTFC